MAPDLSPGLTPGAARTGGVAESVIREMTREAHRHDAINLSQGIPDAGETPDPVSEAARAAIDTDSQYTITWGLPDLREAVADRYAAWKGVQYDPDTEVTITCGTSEAILSAVLALCDPGDGVCYFEPTYENYIPSIRFAGGTPRPVALCEDLAIDESAFRDAAAQSTILILNSPQNPTGKVFSREELSHIADVAVAEDLVVITDEIYEHIVYEDFTSPVNVGDLAARTVCCTGLSKTYSVTGWRVGFALAPAGLAAELRKVHDYATICAPTPFQRAAIEALSLPDSFYTDLAASYQGRRDQLYEGLDGAGLSPRRPDGAYYMMARYPTDEPDHDFAMRLAREAGVATVPGSSFYADADDVGWIRFTFSRSPETIAEAIDRIDANRWW